MAERGQKLGGENGERIRRQAEVWGITRGKVWQKCGANVAKVWPPCFRYRLTRRAVPSKTFKTPKISTR